MLLIAMISVVLKMKKKATRSVIKNKKTFIFSISLFFIIMALNFPFPHRHPYGEEQMAILNIPIRLVDGFHTLGILSVILFLVSLVLFIKSLKKYRGRFVLIVFFSLTMLPFFTINVYQKTIAKGIYAVAYSREASSCQVEQVNEHLFQGICELEFINHSNEDVQFTVAFEETMIFEEEHFMMSLMNVESPYTVHLKAKDKRRIQINTKVDVSHIKSPIMSGEMMIVPIEIIAEGESRKL